MSNANVIGWCHWVVCNAVPPGKVVRRSSVSRFWLPTIAERGVRGEGEERQGKDKEDEGRKEDRRCKEEGRKKERMQQRYYAVTRAICPLLITRAMRYCLCTKSTQTTIHDVAANEKGETGSLHTTSRHSKARQSKAKDYFACSTTHQRRSTSTLHLHTPDAATGLHHISAFTFRQSTPPPRYPTSAATFQNLITHTNPQRNPNRK
ncbi:hypothetical protein B0H13DRAFT_1886697 [Mycena leptocephala]|nr:hypothetical protein B0H13DRAFT_1886697 [Mycena leptocephala]